MGFQEKFIPKVQPFGRARKKKNDESILEIYPNFAYFNILARVI